MPKPTILEKENTYKNTKAVDIDKSRDDLRDAELYTNLHESLDMIISCYNSTLADVMESHAPLRTRVDATRRRVA